MEPKAEKTNWRERSGVADDLRLPRPAPSVFERSTSEGDMKKGSYRNSGYPRLFCRAVCNDDGTPVAAKTEVLLEALLEEIRALREVNERAFEVLKQYEK